MFNQFLELENGNIYGINVKTTMRTRIMNKILSENKNKRVMLWQSGYEYFDCKRLELSFNTDLIDLFETYSKDFDVLIINYISDWANTKETSTFLQYLKNDNRLKDKCVIIIFKQKVDYNCPLKIEDFHNILDAILTNCDEFYIFNPYKGLYLDFEVEEIFSNTKRYWREIGDRYEEWTIKEIDAKTEEGD
ncbi:MAG: hypothetical protein MJ149_02740 [Clostridia bacterium]|nr:hypothetical protein [Clostridia bacterium]